MMGRRFDAERKGRALPQPEAPVASPSHQGRAAHQFAKKCRPVIRFTPGGQICRYGRPNGTGQRSVGTWQLEGGGVTHDLMKPAGEAGSLRTRSSADGGHVIAATVWEPRCEEDGLRASASA
jgi:hypothetical protein